MKFKQYITEKLNITFKDEQTGYHSGQSDQRLTVFVDNEPAGYIDYVDYEGEISVSMIEVAPKYRGKKVGTDLILKLQSMYPKTELKLGMLTDKGSKLINSVKSRLYVDRARIRKIETLKKEYYKIKKLEQDTEKSGDWSNWDNDIYDRQYEIEQELWHDYNIDIRE